jgi:selenide, water dikinase
VASMTRLNDVASVAAIAAGATAATDVTGFGLLGHLHRLASASGVACRLDVDAVPILPGVRELVAAGTVPGGTVRNRDQAARFVHNPVDELRMTLLCDAQTSGGLLIACPPETATQLTDELTCHGHQAAVIGEVVTGSAGTIDLADTAT